MKHINGKQKLFFLILGVFGLSLTTKLLFSVHSIDHIQASTADLTHYLQFTSNKNQSQKTLTFPQNYLPKTLVQLKSNNAKNKKQLQISCSTVKNQKHTSYSKKERQSVFAHTLLPHIVSANSHLLVQRFYVLNILKNQLDKIYIKDYKDYMLYRKVKHFKKSKLFLSDIKTLKNLKNSPLVVDSLSAENINPDFSIFSKNIGKKEALYIKTVNLKKYNLTKKNALYIKRLAYKNWLRTSIYRKNANLLLMVLISSVDIMPSSLFLAQAKEESDMGQSRAAYTLNNLFGAQITPNKKFNSHYMGRVCKSKNVRLRKFADLQTTINFQLGVYNQNLATMSLIKNNRLLDRLNLKALQGVNIIDKMPGYAEKKGYKKRLTKALAYFTEYDRLDVMAEKLFLSELAK